MLQIKDMSDRDLARYWSNYVKEIAVLLVSVEGDPHPPEEVVGRIQELVQKELLFLYIRLDLTASGIALASGKLTPSLCKALKSIWAKDGLSLLLYPFRVDLVIWVKSIAHHMCVSDAVCSSDE